VEQLAEFVKDNLKTETTDAAQRQKTKV